MNGTFWRLFGFGGFGVNPSRVHMLKSQRGRKFSLPGANELASNRGVTAPSGNEQVATLKSGTGWQADAALYV